MEISFFMRESPLTTAVMEFRPLSFIPQSVIIVTFPERIYPVLS